VEIPSDLVVVGYVSGAYGLQGWVRIKPYSAEADALLHAKTWWLGNPELPQQLRDIDMMQAKTHSGDVVARLVGVGDREAAEAMRGNVVQVSRKHFPSLGDGEYYWVDLIGLEVENLQGERVGKVDGLIDNGAHPILKVSAPGAEPGSSDGQREVLIPFVDQYVKTVDRAANKIVADWGLDF
jgi:16S rRNA processing protein RimM